MQNGLCQALHPNSSMFMPLESLLIIWKKWWQNRQGWKLSKFYLSLHFAIKVVNLKSFQLKAPLNRIFFRLYSVCTPSKHITDSIRPFAFAYSIRHTLAKTQAKTEWYLFNWINEYIFELNFACGRHSSNICWQKICICQNIEFPKMFVKIQTNQCHFLLSAL